MRLTLAAVLTAWAPLLGAVGLSAQGLTQDEALRLAFPEADAIERRTAYLDDAQRAKAAEWAGQDRPLESGVVTYYVAVTGDLEIGVAYFDVHRVRTMNEVVMVVVGSDERIRRVEVLRFSEPPEYRAPSGWLDEFRGRALSDRVSQREEVANIAGATLTARAVTSATRRVLALHRLIAPLKGGAP